MNTAIVWCDDIDKLKPLPSTTQTRWLQETRPLSQQYRQYWQTIKLDLLSQTLSQASIQAAQKLGMTDDRRALVREIVLSGDNNPLNFARVTIPQATYLAYQHIFDTLGEQLIGEAFLYQQQQLKRSSFEFAIFPPSQLPDDAGFKNLPSTLYARRSIFYIDHYQLMIEEVFLRDFEHYLPH